MLLPKKKAVTKHAVAQTPPVTKSEPVAEIKQNADSASLSYLSGTVNYTNPTDVIKEVAEEVDDWPAPTPKDIPMTLSEAGLAHVAADSSDDSETEGEAESLLSDSLSATEGVFRLDFSEAQPIDSLSYEGHETSNNIFRLDAKPEITEGISSGNKQFSSDFVPAKPGWRHIGTPDQVVENLNSVGYQCYHYLAVQLCLLMNTDFSKIRALLLEGPSGCGKSFMAKSLAKIAGAEMLCLSCYKGMPTQNLIETPSTLAMVNAMAGKGKDVSAQDMMNLGIISRAYLLSQEKPVLLLIDELDKPDSSIDTFFLGPIQDARIWLESRPAIDANTDNLLIVFTKNWNRTIDEALLRRVHPVRMTYLDSTLERKILAPHCHPVLVDNLVTIADRMRNTGGSYAFERPPAPEELLTAGHYVQHLLQWNMSDFGFVGKNIWAIIAKSEHDRAVLEHMMRFHPDFLDPLFPDGKNAPLEEIHAKLGRIILNGLVSDPRAAERERAWKTMEFN